MTAKPRRHSSRTRWPCVAWRCRASESGIFALAIPDTVLTLMAPGATNVTPPVELFGSRTRPVFDELGAARTLAQMIVDGIFQRDRAARLAQFAAHGSNLTLGGVIDAMIGATW